jgi:hypothetical protein
MRRGIQRAKHGASQKIFWELNWGIYFNAVYEKLKDLDLMKYAILNAGLSFHQENAERKIKVVYHYPLMKPIFN